MATNHPPFDKYQTFALTLACRDTTDDFTCWHKDGPAIHVDWCSAAWFDLLDIVHNDGGHV